MTDVPDPGLSAGEVARRLGVAVTTVRTWDRRYGLGPPQAVLVLGLKRELEDVVALQVDRKVRSAGHQIHEPRQTFGEVFPGCLVERGHRLYDIAV